MVITQRQRLAFADRQESILNRHYLSIRPKGTFLMVKYPKSGAIAELQLVRDSLPTDYNVILDIRNESAVAALALHQWELYESNNKVYTQLFREMSADNTLDDYVRTMEVSRTPSGGGSPDTSSCCSCRWLTICCTIATSCAIASQ